MRLWKFLSGYVNIIILGKYPERLVNRCISEGVRLTDCQRTGGGLSADVSITEAKSLRRLARGSGCRVRLGSRHGVPKLISLVRANAVFALCAAVFAAAMFAAASRVWFIRVDSDVIPEAEILRFLEDMGVKRGVGKRSFDCRELESSLMKDRRLVSASASFRGVVLEVSVSDASLKDAPAADDTPASVYADKDCVITYITVSSGHAEAVKGQAVKKGDLLINGDLGSSKEGYAVRADGVIYGETLYSASAVAAREKSELIPSGEATAVTAISVFGFSIGPFPPCEEYELTPLREGSFTASPFPIKAVSYECRRLEQTVVRDSEDGTKLRAELLAQERLRQILPKDAKLISVKTQCSILPDGSAEAISTAVAVERIGETRSINGKPSF